MTAISTPLISRRSGNGNRAAECSEKRRSINTNMSEIGNLICLRQLFTSTADTNFRKNACEKK